MVWFGLRQHPSEASVKVSSRSALVWWFQRRFRVGLVRFGLVRFGLVIFKLYIKLLNQTKPNELKLLPDIANLISGNFCP